MAAFCWSRYRLVRPFTALRAATSGVAEDSKRQMHPDEIRRLLQSRGQSDAAATDSQVVRNTGAGSLSPDLWRRYASSRTNDPAEITLTKLKFVKDDRHGALRATVGGVLLAARDPREWLPNAFIQAVCTTAPGRTAIASSTRWTSVGRSTGRYEMRCSSWSVTGASPLGSGRPAATSPIP